MEYYTKTHIPPHSFIGEYTGERCTETERLLRYPRNDSGYLMVLCANSYIDARDPRISGPLRYVNQSDISHPANAYFITVNSRIYCMSFGNISIPPSTPVRVDYGNQFVWDKTISHTITHGY